MISMISYQDQFEWVTFCIFFLYFYGEFVEYALHDYSVLHRCFQSSEETPAQEKLYEAPDQLEMEEDLYENVYQPTVSLSFASFLSLFSSKKLSK